MKAIVFCFFTTISVSLYAQTIPLQQRVDWHLAGNHSEFPSSVVTVNVMSFGAIADGIADNTLAYNNAVASLGGQPGIIYFPYGQFRFTSVLNVPDSVWVMGAGSDSTLLKIDHTSTGLNFSGNATNVFTKVLWGFQKGSDRIRVLNPVLFQQGNFCELHQDNGSWDTSPATWATYALGAILRIDTIIGDTLVFEETLNIDFDTALNLEIQKINPRLCAGVSCLKLERTNTSTTANGYNIHFNYASGCCVYGVESNKSQASHCMIGTSSHITVSGCYFHDAYLYDGSGTKGYGITLNSHSCYCLIENNILKHLRHAMMTKLGANGNVFAYNYSLETFRNGSMEYPQDYCGDISLHGHYSFSNLFEGNIIQNLMIDDYWGPSGPYNTFFRNRVEHYGFVMSPGQTNNQNICGNEITGSGYTFPFSWGAYTITGSGHYQYGNNKNGTLIPSGTNALTDSSCYLDTLPWFWNPGDPWPSIGMPNAINSGSIPAKQRYISGNYTSCSFPQPITYCESPLLKTSVGLCPNPFSENVMIITENRLPDKIEIYNCYGQFVRQICPVSAEIQVCGLKPGVYFFRLSSGNETEVFKMLCY